MSITLKSDVMIQTVLGVNQNTSCICFHFQDFMTWEKKLHQGHMTYQTQRQKRKKHSEEKQTYKLENGIQMLLCRHTSILYKSIRQYSSSSKFLYHGLFSHLLCSLWPRLRKDSNLLLLICSFHALILKNYLLHLIYLGREYA